MHICRARACTPPDVPKFLNVMRKGVLLQLAGAEEYPGESDELTEALTVLREWVRDVYGQERPLFQLLDQALDARDLSLMRVAIDVWDQLPDLERARILRNSNLTIH